MVTSIENIFKLYDKGLSFEEYIRTGGSIVQKEHFQSFWRIRFSDNQLSQISNIKNHKKLLVFCNVQCKDCQITLALLEGIKRVNPKFDYKIIFREPNFHLLKEISNEQRIPLILYLKDFEYGVIYCEFPDILKKFITSSTIQEAETLRDEFRKGIFNDEVFTQIFSQLEI